MVLLIVIVFPPGETSKLTDTLLVGCTAMQDWTVTYQTVQDCKLTDWTLADGFWQSHKARQLHVKVFEKTLMLTPPSQFAPQCAMTDFEPALVLGFQQVFASARVVCVVRHCPALQFQSTLLVVCEALGAN